MSKEAVMEYIEKLTQDEEFVDKVVATGDDKKAKMDVIRSYGMDFTEEEFIEVTRECKQKLDDEGLDLEKELCQLDDSSLETVTGGGIVSTPAMLLATVGGTVGCTVLGAAIGGGCGVCVGAASGPGAAVTGAAGGLYGAAVGFLEGLSGGLTATFFSLFSPL